MHNGPLHIAATKNYVLLAKFLIDSYPSMLIGTNGEGELPVEVAIRQGQDDVAAFLIRRMDHRRLVHVLVTCIVAKGFFFLYSTSLVPEAVFFLYLTQI